MEIRRLTPKDAPIYWQLRLEALLTEPFAFGKAGEEHRATPVEEIAARFQDATPRNFTLGAFEHEELAGMATFKLGESLKERHKGRIYGVYVAPSARRRGVGKALIGRLLEIAKENSSLEQVLLAVGTRQAAARQLYRTFGFTGFGIEPHALKVGAEYIDEEHMVLRVKEE